VAASRAKGVGGYRQKVIHVGTVGHVTGDTRQGFMLLVDPVGSRVAMAPDAVGISRNQYVLYSLSYVSILMAVRAAIVIGADMPMNITCRGIMAGRTIIAGRRLVPVFPSLRI